MYAGPVLGAEVLFIDEVLISLLKELTTPGDTHTLNVVPGSMTQGYKPVLWGRRTKRFTPSVGKRGRGQHCPRPALQPFRPRGPMSKEYGKRREQRSKGTQQNAARCGLEDGFKRNPNPRHLHQSESL